VFSHVPFLYFFASLLWPKTICPRGYQVAHWHLITYVSN
jgi:hypothetical protein